jgi:hypothetical protein
MPMYFAYSTKWYAAQLTKFIPANMIFERCSTRRRSLVDLGSQPGFAA